MYNSIKVDGVTYDMICDIKRTGIIKSSDLSGMMLDKTYFNDVLGTYFEYTINLVVPYGKEQQYNTLYEILTNPVASHIFTLPYGQSTTNITGRVAIISDELANTENRGNFEVNVWRKTSFKIIANKPSKVV